MKQKSIVLILLLLLFILSFQSISQDNNKNNSPILNSNIDELNIIELRGNSYEIGKQHGKALKDEIKAVIELWKDDLVRNYGIEADTFISKFYHNTSYIETIRKWTPNLLEEIRGISDGCDIDFKTIFMFQLIDEQWVEGRNIINQHKCTSIGIKKHNTIPSMIGQNIDIPGFFHGFQTLLKIDNTDTGIKSFVFTVAGLIGANGMNNYSLGVNVNTISQLKHCIDGLPVACVVRGILDKQSYGEAVQFINTIKHASGQNYLIGSLDNVGSYECSAGNVAQYKPDPKGIFTYHTNHPLSNPDYDPDFIDYVQRVQGKKLKDYIFNCSRLDVLEKRIKNSKAEKNLDLLLQTLKSREGTGATINNSSTFGSTIMILTKDPELRIASGNPLVNQFLNFKFQD